MRVRYHGPEFVQGVVEIVHPSALSGVDVEAHRFTLTPFTFDVGICARITGFQGSGRGILSNCGETDLMRTKLLTYWCFVPNTLDRDYFRPKEVHGLWSCFAGLGNKSRPILRRPKESCGLGLGVLLGR